MTSGSGVYSGTDGWRRYWVDQNTPLGERPVEVPQRGQSGDRLVTEARHRLQPRRSPPVSCGTRSAGSRRVVLAGQERLAGQRSCSSSSEALTARQTLVFLVGVLGRGDGLAGLPGRGQPGQVVAAGPVAPDR